METKKMYKGLLKAHHPDCGGTDENTRIVIDLFSQYNKGIITKSDLEWQIILTLPSQ